MAPLAKYWGLGSLSPQINVCRNGAQTGQTGFTMPLSRLLVSGIFQSLRVAGAPFEAPF